MPKPMLPLPPLSRLGSRQPGPIVLRLLGLLDLALPTECGGCRRPGASWCQRCDRALARLARPAPAVRVSAHDRSPVVWVWGDYRAPLDRVISAWKDEGRRDLTGLLAQLLARSIEACLSDSVGAPISVRPQDRAPRPVPGPGPVGLGSRSADDGSPRLVVPVPSSRHAQRRRGDAPLDSLAASALRALATGPPLGLPPPSCSSLRFVPSLAHRRAVDDQSHLDLGHRWQNLEGSMRVAPAWRAAIVGRRCIVVDDVVTTGATLAEAARALRAAGATEVLAAAVAATPRRTSPLD